MHAVAEKCELFPLPLCASYWSILFLAFFNVFFISCSFLYALIFCPCIHLAIYTHCKFDVEEIVSFQWGRAVAQAVSCWLPTAAARVRVWAGMWGLCWTKRHWGRFSPSTSVSPANHSTNFSIIIITRGWHNTPISGCGAEWTLDSTPHYTN
jgi:hypothetical protein